MDGFSLLALLTVLGVLGACAGMAAGMVPGLHVNNVALLVAAVGTSLAGDPDAVLAAAAFLGAAAVAHGSASLLPSVFLGAPDPESALTVLPGHRLLARGKGHEAVLLGARGALLGALLAIAAVLPFRMLLGPPVDAYAKLRPLLPLLLLTLLALLLATEGSARDRREVRRKRAWAIGLVAASGLLGLAVLTPGFLASPWVPWRIGGESLVLFPLFTGLFGLPTLLLSLRTHGHLPPQDIGPPEALPDWRRARAGLSGVLAGAAVSWIPGLGGTNATIVAQLLAGGEPKEGDAEADREFLFAASAAGAATTVFTLVALFVILRARSGVAAAIDAVAQGVPAWEPLGGIPPLLAALLLAVLVSAGVAFLGVTRLARPFAILASRVRYGRLAAVVAVGLVAAVLVLTGPLGLLVLGTATALGLLPPLVGVRRVHLMGCLLVPLLAAAL